MAEIKKISVADIDPNPNGHRRNFDQAALDRLAQSIKEVGVLQPLMVVPVPVPGDGLRFRLVCGERRWMAAKIVGLAEVPALVDESLTPAQEAEIALIDNLQRESLNPIEEAMAYEKLIKEHGYSQRALARKVGVSQGHIGQRISLLDLPEEIQKMITRVIISPTHARSLVSFKHLPAEVLVTAANNIIANEVPVTGVVTEIYRAVAALGKPLFSHVLKFDPYVCKGCPHVSVGDRWDPTPPADHKYCLNISCYDAKESAALESKQKELAKKFKKLIAAGWKIADLDNLEHDEFERLKDSEGCEGCEFRAIGQAQWMDEPVEVCLNPSCYKGKMAQAAKAKKNMSRSAFMQELERISALARVRVEYFARIETRENGMVALSKDAVVYIAGRILSSVTQAEDRKITLYKYLKGKFGWNKDWLKSNNRGYTRENWDEFRQLLESLDERQLMELIIEWPAVAQGLDGAERWLLQPDDEESAGEVEKTA